MARTGFSCFLTLWVGLICPSLCALAATGPVNDAPTSCCSRCGPKKEKAAPARESNREVPSSCFCAGQGLTAPKAESLEFHTDAKVVIVGFPGIDNLALRFTGIIPIGSRCARPPDAGRHTPLLI